MVLGDLDDLGRILVADAEPHARRQVDLRAPEEERRALDGAGAHQ